MIIKNKNIKRVFSKLFIAFVLVAIAEYLAIIFLSSLPVILFKVQGLIAVVFIAYLMKSTYKIWRYFNLEHPFTKNGKQQ